MADFNQIKNDIAQLLALQDKVAADFKTVLRDDSISLDDRWDLFVKAPDDLKTVKSWIWQSSALGSDFEWYDDVGCERHETVDLIDFVCTLERDIELINKRGDTGTHYSYKLAKKPGVIAELKEELMRLNMRAFVFDW